MHLVKFPKKYSKEHLSGAFFWDKFQFPASGHRYFFRLRLLRYVTVVRYFYCMAAETEATKLWRSLPNKKVIISNGHCATVINGQQINSVSLVKFL